MKSLEVRISIPVCTSCAHCYQHTISSVLFCKAEEGCDYHTCTPKFKTQWWCNSSGIDNTKILEKKI